MASRAEPVMPGREWGGGHDGQGPQPADGAIGWTPEGQLEFAWTDLLQGVSRRKCSD